MATIVAAAAGAERAMPVAAGERIELLDALRGFALLGVLCANMLSFAGWWMIDERAQVALAGAIGREVFMDVFTALVDGKFYTIFSLLFGVGFALQIDRLERRGDHAAARFARRMAGLLAIGLTHLLLIWYGDILTLYALAGLVLIAVRKVSDRALLTAAALLILGPIPGAWLVHALGISPDFGLTAVSERAGAMFPDRGSFEAAAAWMRRPSWSAFAAWQATGAVWRVGSLIESWRLAKVIAIMMIGMWVGRRLLDGTMLSDRARLRRIALWGAIVGVPANLAYMASDGIEGPWSPGVAAAQLAYALGVVPLGLAYAAGFALLWSARPGRLGVLAPVGRMALTNYLGQSVICVFIFHGIGLGLAGLVSPLAFTVLALALFAAQVALSRAWLARFGQGPVERLWRWLTYGERTQPARAER